MKLLLIGERYSENLGDAVICETVRKLIQSKFNDIEITDFDISGRSGYNKYYSIRELRRNKCPGYKKIFLTVLLRKFFCGASVNLRRYLRVLLNLNENLFYNKFDIVLFAGGALFQDYFADLIYCIVKKCSIKCSVINFHACGIGNLSNHSIEVLRKTFRLDCVKDISVRDSYYRFVNVFGSENKVTSTYDTALCCNEFYDGSKKKIAEYGIGCIDCKDTFYIQKDIIRVMINSGVSWKIFTNGAPYDEEIVDRLLKELDIVDRKNEFVVSRAMDAKSLVTNITSFKKIISFRLHSHIIAASYGIPSYGFAWDLKVEEFFMKIGIPKLCKGLSQEISYGNIFEEMMSYPLNMQEKIMKQANLSKEDLYRQIPESVSLTSN